MIPGIQVTIGAETFTVPAISLGQLRGGLGEKIKTHDEAIAREETFPAMLLRGEIILACLRRNYPDFPEDKLYDYLDLSNVGQIWLSILGVSGFTPGETQAAVTTETNGT